MNKYSQLMLVTWLFLAVFFVFTACGQTAGSEIVLREASTGAEGNAAIYLIDADSSHLTKLTGYSSRNT